MGYTIIRSELLLTVSHFPVQLFQLIKFIIGRIFKGFLIASMIIIQIGLIKKYIVQFHAW